MLGWWGRGAGGAVSRPHPTETSPAQEAPDPAPRTSRTAGQSTEDISGAKDDGSLGPARIPRRSLEWAENQGEPDNTRLPHETLYQPPLGL